MNLWVWGKDDSGIDESEWGGLNFKFSIHALGGTYEKLSIQNNRYCNDTRKIKP